MFNLRKYNIFKEYVWKRSFRVDNFLALHIRYLKHSGCWPIDFARWLPASLGALEAPLRGLYFLMAAGLPLHMLVVFLYSFLYNVMNAENATLAEISDCLVDALIYGYTCFAICYLQLRNDKCVELVSFMNENYKMRSAVGLTYVTSEPCYRLANQVSITWHYMLLSAAAILCLLPLYTLRWDVPQPTALYPFDIRANLAIFVLIYTLQSLGLLIVAYVFTNVGNLLTSTTFLVCGQYDILFCSLKNIRHTAVLMKGMKMRQQIKKLQLQIDLNAEEVNQYNNSYEQLEDLDSVEPISRMAGIGKEAQRRSDTYLMDLSTEHFESLRSCIRHHQIILQACNRMEDFFSPLMIVASFQMTLQICNLAYVLSRPTSQQAKIKSIQYLFLTFLHLLLVSHAGSCLKEHSVRVVDALTRCPWYLCGGPFRRDIQLMMQCSRIPKVLTCGKFFVLDYDKMKAIISASFSYYTMLNQLG